MTTQKRLRYSIPLLQSLLRRSAFGNPRSPRCTDSLVQGKSYPQWKKIRLHSLFCGCSHWWKMQCSFITKGLFTRILSHQQQDTSFLQEQLVSVLYSLLENPDMKHQFLTLPIKSGYWETVLTHVLSVRESYQKHHHLRVNMSWQFQ